MSKKKAFGGSTMTLKDFHGGSIPSDLPLPSAPGVVAKPSDRPSFDRQIPNSWGNPMGRQDHRSRPGSSGASRTFDEKSSFLSHPSHIGRYFDEDERKPFDGAAVPRRTAGDNSPPLSRPDPKPDSGMFLARPASNPISHSLGPTVPAKLPVVASWVASSHFVGGNIGQTVGASAPNAWAGRKEVVSAPEPAPSPISWSGQSTVSKFAQVSALEKVQSGRWQSKPSIYNQPDVEAIRYTETEIDARCKDHSMHSTADQINDRGGDNVARGRYEKGRVVEDGGRGGGNEFPDYERVRSPMYLEARERNFYHDGFHPASIEGKLGESQSRLQVPVEASERPKLKLLPRSKPVEASDTLILDYKQGYHPPADLGKVEVVNESYGNTNPPKPGSTGNEGGNWAIEQRPKLNLKPRLQPIEQLDGSGERERETLFGGARPRELVLKERRVEDVVIQNLDSDRVKHDVPNVDAKPESTIQAGRHGERPQNLPHDQRAGRDFERKDYRMDAKKTDMQGSSRRNENGSNGKEFEKHQEHWQPEPDTWHKPIEPPIPQPSDASGPCCSRAASALELAQSFSRTVSNPQTADQFTSQRSLPGRNQVPFSRLTDTREFYSGAAPKINGY